MREIAELITAIGILLTGIANVIKAIKKEQPKREYSRPRRKR